MKRFLCVLSLFGLFSLTALPHAKADDSAVASKLDQLQSNQAQILKELDEIKAELEIVKVRVSLRN